MGRSEEEKLAHGAYMREWRAKNAGHVREYERAYAKHNADKIRENARIRYAKNPSKKIKANFRFRTRHPERRVAYTHGLSHEQAAALRSGTCGICGKRGTRSKPLHIDHCHRSGKVRGALCGRCNSAIGFLNDDVSLLHAAVLYLERFA